MHTVLMSSRIAAAVFFAGACFAEGPGFEYKLLATSKTSTMEKELNEAAESGYVYAGVMGGESAWGGKEVVVIMARNLDGTAAPRKQYRLLATNRTGTLEKELRAAGAEGFDYCGQTIFESAFGGREVAVILARDPASERRVDYKLLATAKTSTMQIELRQAGAEGFSFAGVMVGQTALGGKEVVSLLRRYRE